MTPRIALVVAALGVLVVTRAEAQSGGSYSLGWSTLDGGGQQSSSGGAYTLGGTAGQPDAPRLTGGIYALNGGFWNPAGGGPVDAPADAGVPLAFAARPATPNPFRTTTSIAFDLPEARSVEMALYGIDGRLVRRLIDHALPAGRHRAVWDGRDDRGLPVPTGMYFARLRAGAFTSTLRVIRID